MREHPMIGAMRGRTPSLVASLVLAVGACGDDLPDSAMPGSTGGPTGSGSTTTQPADGSTLDPGATTGDAGSDESGFDPPVPTCGNGYVEDGEQCDDANMADDDACSNACLVPCGLDWSAVVPAPTLDSQVDGLHVADAPDGGVAIAAFQREITTDRRGNQTIADDTVVVARWDARGRLAWQATLASADGDLTAAGIAIDASGDVHVATTTDAADEGTAIEVRRLAAIDGSEVWAIAIEGDVPGGEDVATGIALAPDGDLVVSGHVRVADGDNDVWVRKVAVADGAEVWTSTHSGVANGGFSTDTGGPVTVAADGEVYVLGRIYVDFETVEATLLRFDADGAGLVWALPPGLPGAVQQWFALDVVTTDDDAIVYAIDRSLGAELDFHVRKVDRDAEVLWTLDDEAFVTEGSDFRLSGLSAVPGGVVVGGSRTNDFTIGGTAWTEVWLARLDADGATQCRNDHAETGRGLVPPSVVARGVAAGADASAFVTGRTVTEQESAIWIGRFRPPQ